MSVTSKSPFSGRTFVATLAVLAAAILGGVFLLFSRAQAQTRQANHDTTFAPVDLADISTAGDLELLPSMFLPAVQNATTPFRVQLLFDGGSVTMPIAEGPASSLLLEVWIDTNSSTLVSHIHLYNPFTNEERTSTLANRFSLVVVRILPAVSATGQDITPVAATMLDYGTQYDGNTNTYVPYQYRFSPGK